MSSIAKKLRSLSRSQKRSILVLFDVAAMLFGLWAAMSVRLGVMYVPDNSFVIVAALLSTAGSVLVLLLLGVYSIVLRFLELATIRKMLYAAAASAALWVATVYFLQPSTVHDGRIIDVPRSIGLIYCGFLFALLLLGRYVMAALLSTFDQNGNSTSSRDRRPVAIYGVNPAGISLAQSVQRDSKYWLRAFIDDDPALTGRSAARTPIYSPADLPRLLDQQGIREVFLAVPSVSRAERLAIITRLSNFDVEIKTVPAPEEIVSGRFAVTDIRAVDVKDLLARDPVEPLTSLIQQSIEGRSILVTGAGGSIGSELCRQIARGKPKKMVLLDHSEYALYTIEQEIRLKLACLDCHEQPELIAIVGSVTNERLIRELIYDHDVDCVYHAAAYKHVPLLERNEIAGIENNVFGTLAVARASLESNISRFTLISTDKAVRPRSVMGASKRVAELVVQACAERTTRTSFGIVRFGNVLDSSGSVVQLFRSQIAQGGPVTVTHPEITRFFMSIPEATQLVLQASAMANSGEVFVLDMGDPVRIDELARSMIRLSGMTVRDADNPDGDVEIAYVGLRPGEKLYEELFVGGKVISTVHPRIRKALERSVPFNELEPWLERLRATTDKRDAAAARSILLEVVEPDEARCFNSEAMEAHLSQSA